METSRSGVLTARERQVCGLAAAGLKDKQIGDQLSIAVGTVGVHLANAFRKLGINRRRQIKGALSDVPAWETAGRLDALTVIDNFFVDAESMAEAGWLRRAGYRLAQSVELDLSPDNAALIRSYLNEDWYQWSRRTTQEEV